MDLSVIIPCYNVEEYVEDCIKSVLKNKVPNMEIILVNDGSPDNSLEILRRYEKKYPDLIKVLDQKNQGLSMGRNNGVKIAKGRYIAFVDSDDSIEPGMYKAMLKKAKEKDFDVVACGVNIIYPDHTDKVLSGLKEDLFTNEDIKNDFNNWYTVAWNKIYKRELFDKVQFKKGVWYEDVEFLYKLLPYINSIGRVDEYYNNYMQREGSITYTYNEKLYHIIDNFDGLVEFYKKNKFYDKYHDELEYGYVRYLFATFMKRLSKAKDKKKYNEGYKVVKEKVKANFPNYKKNKYLTGAKGLYLKNYNKLLANIVYLVEKDKMN